MSSSQLPGPQKLSFAQWMLVVLASIGFLFDIYEILVLPLIAEPAMQELIGAHVEKGTPEFTQWAILLFFIPAVCGGIFGLLGGYLTDRLGRRRVLTWSILLYAVSAFLAGFSTSMEMLLILRCTTFVGVCVEFVAAVAWLAEMFSDPKQRERVLGYTQAFSSVGGLLAAVVFAWVIPKIGSSLPALSIPGWASFLGEINPLNAHSNWRYALMSGAIPAIPLIIIRPFLPESPVWQQRKDAGTLKRPSIKEIFDPKYRRATIVATIMFACSYGAAFGALQQTARSVGGIPEVAAEKGKHIKANQTKIKESVEAAAPETEKEKKTARKMATIRVAREVLDPAAGKVTTAQEIGGLVGRFLLALLVIRVASRRKLIRIFQVPGLIVIPLVYLLLMQKGIVLTYIGIFLAGLFTVGQFSFWGNYLPTMYPVHLRGTGSTFAANIGGRIFGTAFAAASLYLAGNVFTPANSPEAFMKAAAIMGTFAFALGFIMSFFLPEPSGEALDQDDGTEPSYGAH